LPRWRQAKPQLTPVGSGLGVQPSFPELGGQRSGKGGAVDLQQFGQLFLGDPWRMMQSL
jgi:hypothetical protein